jgi:hypothetical protein
MFQTGKGTRQVRLRKRSARGKKVRFGEPDESLTGSGGVVALAELSRKLRVVRSLDAGIGAVKQRVRGVSGGQVVAALAQCQLLGGQNLSALDEQRLDVAAGRLSALPALPSTTAAGLARRFGADQLAGIEAGAAGVTARAFGMLAAERREALCAGAVTIDMDSTDVEVYGRRKQGVAYNYQGRRVGRPHVAAWAQAGLVLAADLMSGRDDVRPAAGQLLRRALAALPAQVLAAAGTDERRVRVRADAGYFTAELAHAAIEAGCDYAIAAKRNKAAWRAYAAVPEDAWQHAKGMHGAFVAVLDYRPEGWPPESYTIVRRVRVETAEISADGRSRRRRTIPAEQLALALGGQLDHVWAVSFIVTNIPTGGHEKFDSAVDVEAWFRRRTDIEDRFKDAKLGAALRHLPSGHEAVNAVWMWAALLAVNLSVLLQALTGIDEHGRAHCARLRRELLCIPARVIRHAGRLEMRLPPGRQTLLPEVLTRLRELPATA